MGRSEGSHTKYMGLRSLIYFVWGFLSYILYGDFVNSWSSKGTLSTQLIEPSPSGKSTLIYIIYEGSKAKMSNFTRNCGLLGLYETLYSLFLSRNAFTRLRTALISVEIYHINTK